MNTDVLNRLERALLRLKWVMTTMVLFVCFMAFGWFDFLFINEDKTSVQVEEVTIIDGEDVVGGIHVATGLVAEGDYELVLQNCLACHSSKLITQNRMNSDAWIHTIEWMQETQNLWPLGENKEKIAAYLGKYYAPQKVGRRKKLEVEEWYEIE